MRTLKGRKLYSYKRIEQQGSSHVSQGSRENTVNEAQAAYI